MTSSRSNLTFENLLKGAAAGFIGTGPMTASMIIGWMLLPKAEKYPLPPRLIIDQVTERIGVEDDLSEDKLAATSLAGHFAYGALTGAIYGILSGMIRMKSSIKGILAGLAVWAGSYLGWLPAVGILTPATRHPWRRNLLMIFAHFVWGATVGIVFKKLNAEKRYVEL